MAVHKKFTTTSKSNALGRGLDALISTESVKTGGSSTINEVPIEHIMPNPGQPRHDFDEEALQELASSIREIGIIQPITLRQVADNSYQIIAGERRWRASQMAGLATIPAYIRTIRDEQVMEMALVENIQREDLNAIEIALAYEHLLEGEGMTQEKVSERVGKSRTAITNYLRLLKLPAQVQMALQKKLIDMGHARALLSLDSPSQQIKLFKEIIKNGYVSGRAMLGITGKSIDSVEARYYNIPLGVQIVSINSDGAFGGTEAAAGDIIIRFGETEITSMEDLQSCLADSKPGDEVEVTLYRYSATKNNDRTFTVTVKLVENKG